MRKTKRLTDFLMKLATDPRALAHFKEDQDAAMKAAGLTPAQRAAVKSRDPKRLSAAVLKEYVGPPPPMRHVWPIIVILLD